MVTGQVREDVVLRDGSTLRLRQTSQDDQAALVEFFERLSPDTRHLRFQGAMRVDAHLARPFLHSDGEDALSLVAALAGPAGDTRIVALGTSSGCATRRAPRSPSPLRTRCRAGDRKRLLERLAVHARRAGIERFVAQVLPENGAMLRVFGDTGFEVQRRSSTVSSRSSSSSPRPPTCSSAPTAAITRPSPRRWRLLPPRSVAVIGASARRGTIGGELFRNVLAGDFDGTAYPVNRGGVPVGGVHAYARRRDPRARSTSP